MSVSISFDLFPPLTIFLQQLAGVSEMLLLPLRPPSPLCWLAVLATVTIRLPIVVSQQRPGCRPGNYLDVSTGSCLACTDGVNFVEEEYNTQPQCFECTVCRGIMISAVACSAARDTLCHCPNGFTTTIEGLCRPVNPGADDGTPLTDSSTKTVSVLSTGSVSDGHQSTDAKHSDMEATVLRSIDAKLNQLISYVLSVLTLIVLSIVTVCPCIAIRTCWRCKKARERFPHQTVENHYPTTAAAKAPESATATHVDEDKDKPAENRVLLTTLGTDTVDSSAGNNSTTAYRRPVRGTSVPDEVLSC